MSNNIRNDNAFTQNDSLLPPTKNHIEQRSTTQKGNQHQIN